MCVFLVVLCVVCVSYKAWGALLGLLMRSQNCVVVSVDYRNFPQGNIEDMVVDIEQALRWIWDNIEDYGGDRSKLFLAGQSAGAHITSILLLRNAKREAEGMFEDEVTPKSTMRHTAAGTCTTHQRSDAHTSPAALLCCLA